MYFGIFDLHTCKEKGQRTPYQHFGNMGMYVQLYRRHHHDNWSWIFTVLLPQLSTWLDVLDLSHLNVSHRGSQMGFASFHLPFEVDIGQQGRNWVALKTVVIDITRICFQIQMSLLEYVLTPSMPGNCLLTICACNVCIITAILCALVLPGTMSSVFY